MPMLGFGVWDIRKECDTACLNAIKAGYRFVTPMPISFRPRLHLLLSISLGISIQLRYIATNENAARLFAIAV